MKRKAKPVKLITLDTETYDGLKGKLKRIAIYDGHNIHYGYQFSDIESILINYSRMGFSVEIYIHNMEFDLRKIPQVFEKVNWKKSLMINGKLATLTCKDYTFHDSFKILPMSLKKLSTGFNVEHGKLDLWEAVQKTYPDKYKDSVDFLDRCDVDDSLFLEYLGYDVMSLYEVLQVIMNLSGIPLSKFVKRVSTASLSRFIFKNGYHDEPFKSPLLSKSDYEYLCDYKWDNDLEIEDFIRESYCGGRTEVFTPRLEVKGYHYDVNSLYPFVMKKGEYPIGKPQYTEDSLIAEKMYHNWKKDRNGLGFINCRVFIPQQPIPPLPVKMGKLCFPCGEIYGTWTYEELEYAEKECGVEILEFYCGCHFSKTYPVFERFINVFSKIKEQASDNGNEPLRTFAKLIQNVGYGYTGMRRDDKTSLAPYEDIIKYEKVCFADKDAGFIEIPTDVDAEYIQVQVASYVTSRARLVLLKALRNVIKKGGNVYYCDTDSIVSDMPLDDKMVHKSKLGYWKLESQPIKGLFLKPKVYTELFENEEPTIKFKGVSKDTQKTLKYSDYEYYYKELEDKVNDYIIVEKNRLTMRSIMYMQKKGLSPDYYEERDKKMNLKTIEKREMNYKDNNTKPLFFPTLKDFENFSFNKVEKNVTFDMKKGELKNERINKT